jgi:hypothetical protein
MLSKGNTFGWARVSALLEKQDAAAERTYQWVDKGDDY